MQVLQGDKIYCMKIIRGWKLKFELNCFNNVGVGHNMGTGRGLMVVISATVLYCNQTILFPLSVNGARNIKLLIMSWFSYHLELEAEEVVRPMFRKFNRL